MVCHFAKVANGGWQTGEKKAKRDFANCQPFKGLANWQSVTSRYKTGFYREEG